MPGELRVAGGQEILVVEVGDGGVLLREFLVVDVDQQGFDRGECKRFLDDRCEFPVDDQHLGFGMIELEGDDASVQPRVDRVEDAAGHRHPVVRLEHLGRVRAE